MPELLSIIIPVYNEEKTILQIIRKVQNVKLPVKKELIIVDDGSKDRTVEILRKIKGKGIRIFYHNANQGKGAAIRTGLKEAKGTILTIQDADLEYDPNDYKALLEPILKENKKVVYGSRLKGHTKYMYLHHYLGNWALTLMTNTLYGSMLTDMETCYKVFRREVIEGMKLKAKRFDFEPEITAKILKRGYKIVEVPIRFHARKFEEGKKINWKDGAKAAYYLVKYRIMD